MACNRVRRRCWGGGGMGREREGREKVWGGNGEILGGVRGGGWMGGGWGSTRALRGKGGRGGEGTNPKG